jgi:Lar family restriction alleviation protein
MGKIIFICGTCGHHFNDVEAGKAHEPICEASRRALAIEQSKAEEQARKDEERLNAGLLPCPFCGGKARVFDYEIDDYRSHSHLRWKAGCVRCPAESKNHDSVMIAATAWNTRTGGKS